MLAILFKYYSIRISRVGCHKITFSEIKSLLDLEIACLQYDLRVFVLCRYSKITKTSQHYEC